MPDRAPPSNRVLPGAARGPPQRVSGSVLRGVCPPDGSTRSLGRTVFRSAAGEPWRGWPSGMHVELPACVCVLSGLKWPRMPLTRAQNRGFWPTPVSLCCEEVRAWMVACSGCR